MTTTTHVITRTIVVPKGRLGLTLVDAAVGGGGDEHGDRGTRVGSVRDDSPVKDLLNLGDWLVSANGVDVAAMDAVRVADVVARTSSSSENTTLVVKRRIILEAGQSTTAAASAATTSVVAPVAAAGPANSPSAAALSLSTTAVGTREFSDNNQKKIPARSTFWCGLNLNKSFWKLLVVVCLLIFDFYSDLSLLAFAVGGDCVFTELYDCSDSAREYLDTRWNQQFNCDCIHEEITVYYIDERHERVPVRYTGGCYYYDTGEELSVEDFIQKDLEYIYQYNNCGCRLGSKEVWDEAEATGSIEFERSQETDCGPDWIWIYVCVYMSIVITKEFAKMVLIVINICRRKSDDIFRPLIISESPFLILFLFFKPSLWNEMAVRVMSGDLDSDKAMLVNVLTEDVPSIIVSVAILKDPWYSGEKASGESPGPLPYLAIVASVLVVSYDLWRVCTKRKRNKEPMQLETESNAANKTAQQDRPGNVFR